MSGPICIQFILGVFLHPFKETDITYLIYTLGCSRVRMRKEDSN